MLWNSFQRNHYPRYCFCLIADCIVFITILIHAVLLDLFYLIFLCILSLLCILYHISELKFHTCIYLNKAKYNFIAPNQHHDNSEGLNASGARHIENFGNLVIISN